MKKLYLLACALICATSLPGAEPQWPALEKYAVDTLQRYIRIASINPPADTRAAAAFLKGELEKHGITPKLFESGPAGQTNLVARFPGKDRTKKALLLMNHMDVVPVDPKAWPVDPFSGELRDGWIWGRGTLDMKGAAVQQLVALIAMKQAGIVPDRDIVFLATADEESGGTLGAGWMIANHWAEIECDYAIDEGGFVSSDLVNSDKRVVFGISVGEKRPAWLRLRAKGTAAHGSQPIPDNANMTLLRAIERALAIPPTAKPNATVEEMKRALGGKMTPNKFTNAVQGNTITLTSLTSGVGSPPRANVIPSLAEATLDCRLLPGVNAEEFISEMKARINDPNISIERLVDTGDPGSSSTETPLYRAIAAAGKKHHPSAVVTPILVPWGTDSSKLRERKIPAYGVSPTLLDAAAIATMHSDQERIPVDQFLKGIRVFYDILTSSF